MIRALVYAVPLLLATAAVGAADPPEEGDKVLSGMSIVGNDEAPKSLVIVPWKASDPGASPGVSATLDDARQPVDREVFTRALEYYQLMATSSPPASPGAR